MGVLTREITLYLIRGSNINSIYFLFLYISCISILDLDKLVLFSREAL